MKKIIVIIATLLLMTSIASASVIYDLNVINSAPGGVTVPTLVTVELSQINATTVHFDINTIGLSGDSGMRNFYFNTDISGLTSGNIQNITSSTTFAANVGYDAKAADGFGKFDFDISKTGRHDVTSLAFDVVVLAGASISDFVQPSADPAGNGHGLFAAQIFAPGILNTTNTFYVRDGGHSVPEPGMLALLGMGLVGIGIFRRRK